MTGIERLRKLSKDMLSLSLWVRLASGTEKDWDCCQGDGRTVNDELLSIADQIERERACDEDAIENVRLIVGGVIDEMEHHILGHEGADDSPVARWARELREALGGEKCDPADFLPADEREAIAWVHEHGGLESVKKLLDLVVGHCSTEQQLDFDFWLSGRVMYELGFEEDMADRDEVERRLLARLMPEGMEWPKYTDCELVRIGGCWGEDGCDTSITYIERIIFAEDGVYLDNEYNEAFYRHGERVKRPAVLAADGEPLEVEQTVWDANGDELVIVALEDGGRTVTCRYADVGDGIPVHGMWSPSDLTHERPVPAADGGPLRGGDTVYEVEGTGHAYKVVGIRVGDGDPLTPTVVTCDVGDGTSEHFLPSQLTHAKPESIDTWERIEEDSTLSPEVYCHRNGIDISQKDGTEIFLADTVEPMARDLVRRCRALAERERGE